MARNLWGTLNDSRRSSSSRRTCLSSLVIFKKEGVRISQFKSLAVQKQIGRSAYTALELYKKFGLDHNSIVKTVLEF